mgnify:CR=1 FL=1|tara:strand:+ start:711 stop:1574 length:864 start_codon:yes stop_codon:yes gene_type:complete
MILIDFLGVVMTHVHVCRGKLDEEYLRHNILNSLRMYNKKYRKAYGEMVICLDGGSWRRNDFPQYKHKRRVGRDSEQESKSGIDWEETFAIITKISDELADNFHWKVVGLRGAEADDIIGVMVDYTQVFGQHEDVMIISADKDFGQLQKNSNVKQWSYKTKKMIVWDKPATQLHEHIFRGDSSDGVPSVLNGDNVFVDEIRQTPLSQKKIDLWLNNLDNLESIMGEEVYRNYLRNKRMIDLQDTPDSVKLDIINRFEEAKVPSKMKILNYLIKNRCRLLVGCVADFH